MLKIQYSANFEHGKHLSHLIDLTLILKRTGIITLIKTFLLKTYNVNVRRNLEYSTVDDVFSWLFVNGVNLMDEVRSKPGSSTLLHASCRATGRQEMWAHCRLAGWAAEMEPFQGGMRRLAGAAGRQDRQIRSKLASY